MLHLVVCASCSRLLHRAMAAPSLSQAYLCSLWCCVRLLFQAAAQGRGCSVLEPGVTYAPSVTISPASSGGVSTPVGRQGLREQAAAARFGKADDRGTASAPSLVGHRADHTTSFH